MKNLKATLLTIIQYITLAVMLYTNKWIAENPVLMFIQFFGIFIAIWAVLEMAKSKLNITPVPRSGSILIQSGPYKLIRHPMYLSLLLTITPMIFSNISTFNIIIFSIFIVNLVMKMLFEENLLHKFFKEYDVYSKKSWRLLPLVY
jgi:protein-S-isoprenylcysteine O-methyltransferase Ste14